MAYNILYNVLLYVVINYNNYVILVYKLIDSSRKQHRPIIPPQLRPPILPQHQFPVISIIR